MTKLDQIEKKFRDKVCAEVRVRPEGPKNRYRVFTPFRFDDGDRISVILRNEGGKWLLSDEGNTFMRLSYRLDDRALQTEGRSRLIINAVDASSVENRDGELVVPILDERFGDALFGLIQAILRVSDVVLLTREQVRSTFVEDLQHLIESTVPRDRIIRHWNEPRLDPEGRYQVDWFIRAAAEPLFVFALTSEDKVKDATITLHQFERWEYPHRTIGVFHDQENITNKTLARFTDVADKNFSVFTGNEQRIQKYLERLTSQPSSN